MSTPSRGRRIVWVTVAIILAASVLRSPIVAIAPVIRDLEADLGITPTIAGLLTSIPVLCFAVATPLAVWVVRRAGTTFAFSLTLVGLGLSCVLRSLGGIEVVLIGTTLIGVFLTIANVAVPVIIRREYSPARAGLMTGVYTAAINVGTMAATLGTAPLEPTLGWRGAVLVWVVLAIGALAAWVGANGLRTAALPQPAPAALPEDHVPPRVFRSAMPWLLAAALAGQGFSYYASAAWLPSLLSDELGFDASTAGAAASQFHVFGIAGALLGPLVLRRFGAVPAIVVTAVGWATLPIGLFFAPELWPVWFVFCGAAQGAGLTLIIIVTTRAAKDDGHAAALNGLVQGAGYAAASVAPAVVGAVHESTGGWDGPLAVIATSITVFGVLGVAGSRAAAQAARR